MAHHKSAIKRIKTSQAANVRNRQYRARLRLALRKVLEQKDATAAQGDLRNACALLDRLVSKGIIHRNTAARRKARLHRHIAAVPAIPPA